MEIKKHPYREGYKTWYMADPVDVLAFLEMLPNARVKKGSISIVYYTKVDGFFVSFFDAKNKKVETVSSPRGTFLRNVLIARVTQEDNSGDNIPMPDTYDIDFSDGANDSVACIEWEEVYDSWLKIKVEEGK